MFVDMAPQLRALSSGSSGRVRWWVGVERGGGGGGVAMQQQQQLAAQKGELGQLAVGEYRGR